MFTELFTCLYDQSYRFLSSFVVLYLPVSEIANVLPVGVYCCFTGTSSFTIMFTVIILVCLLKRMCIPSFVFIIGCFSELNVGLDTLCWHNNRHRRIMRLKFQHSWLVYHPQSYA